MSRLLVTGSNRGIGEAIMAAAQTAGHDAIGTTRDGRNGTLALSLDDPDQIAQSLTDFHEPIDILINNAGIIGPKDQSTLAMDWPGFQQTLTVNTLAPLAVTQALLPNLRQGTRPRVLSISSQMATMTHRKSDRIAYRASKAALNKVMQGLATDLEPEGICVVLINPGWVRTDMGGAEAAEAPKDVARGILALADRLTMEDTGDFFHFTGKSFPF